MNEQKEQLTNEIKSLEEQNKKDKEEHQKELENSERIMKIWKKNM